MAVVPNSPMRNSSLKAPLKIPTGIPEKHLITPNTYAGGINYPIKVSNGTGGYVSSQICPPAQNFLSQTLKVPTSISARRRAINHAGGTKYPH